MKTVLEICCATFYDVQAAAKAGADRLELNSAFYLGGLTPSLGWCALQKRLVAYLWWLWCAPAAVAFAIRKKNI